MHDISHLQGYVQYIFEVLEWYKKNILSVD